MKKKLIIPLAILIFAVSIFSACSPSASAPTQEELSADASALVEELAAGDYSDAAANHSYSFVMKMLTGKKTLKTIWNSLISTYGEYVDIYEYEYDESAGFANMTIKVAFQNQCIDFKVTYKLNSYKISGLHYSANEDKPYLAGAETEEMPEGITETNFYFGLDEYQLPAILTLPEGDGPFPVVILVHGSGANNADETVGYQSPFRDIAWGLAQQGIATIRYDKRTLVYPESFDDTSTVYEESIQDAALAVSEAMSIEEIDSSQIFVLGHSLGGTLIPRIAALTENAAGYIMMGAALTPLHELIVDQYEYIYSLDEKLSIRERISLYKIKKMSENISELEEDSDTDSSKLMNVSAAYWYDLNSYDIIEGVSEIEKPLLVLQGESDYQVPLSDFNELEEALGEYDWTTFISYPGLGHLMTQAGDPPSPDDYNLVLYVDESVIDDIAEFIKGN